jgi:chloramphenicol O-acetyltransferase
MSKTQQLYNLNINPKLFNIAIENFIEMRFDDCVNSIRETKADSVHIKDVTIDILNASKTVDKNNRMEYISSIIDKWKETVIVSESWKRELYDYCLTHDDICTSMSAFDEGKKVFIVVMDDSTSDNVMDYNEFGFQLLQKYQDSVNDFMVLDKITSSGIEDLFTNIEIIYKRGN